MEREWHATNLGLGTQRETDTCRLATGPPTADPTDGSKTSSFPVYVCVPEWEVEAVIQATPKERKADLVFMQVRCGVCGWWSW